MKRLKYSKFVFLCLLMYIRAITPVYAEVEIPSFIPATQFDYTITPAIELSERGQTFFYKYQVHNSKKSKQSIAFIGFVHPTLLISNMNTVAGWKPDETPHLNFLLWVDYDASENIGKKIKYFTIKCQLVPQIGYFYAQADPLLAYEKAYQRNPELFAEEATTAQLNEIAKRTEFPNGHVKKVTVVPAPFGPNLSPRDIVRHMQNQVRKAQELNLIQSSQLAIQLQTRLQSIDHALLRSDSRKVRQELKELAHWIHHKQQLDIALRVTLLSCSHYLKNRLRHASPPDPEAESKDAQEFNTDHEARDLDES